MAIVRRQATETRLWWAKHSPAGQPAPGPPDSPFGGMSAPRHNPAGLAVMRASAQVFCDAEGRDSSWPPSTLLQVRLHALMGIMPRVP